MSEEKTAVYRRFREWLARLWDALPFRRIAGSPRVQLIRGFAARCNAAPFVPQILFMLLYRLSLDLVYVKLLSPLFAYSGFVLNPSLPMLALSYLLVLLFAPFAAELQNRALPSAKLAALLHYLYFLPMTSYCALSSPNSLLLPIAAAYWALLMLWIYKLPVLTLKPLSMKHTRLVFALLTLLSSAVVLYISGRYTGFRLTLDIINVYDIRAEAEGFAMPRVLSYLLSWQTILLTVELLYWLREKKYVVAAWLIVIYFFYFSIAALKSVFFFLLLVLAAWLLYRAWMPRWCAPLLVLFNLLALMEYALHKSFYLMSLFIRRMMYVPVYLAARYQSYFSENPLLFFRDGILRRLGRQTPYSFRVANLIGEYNGDPTCFANNGLLADLFTNLPTPLGLLVMPLLLALCFRLLDASAARKPEKLYIVYALFFAITFANTSWSTVLLTHGFLPACMMLYFFPSKEDNTL